MAKNQSQVSTLDDDAPEAPVPVATPISGANHDAAMSGKKRTLTIHPGEGENGSDNVFLQINGYAYSIKRGEPVLVPEEVVEVLNNARQTLMSFGPGGAVVERSVPRYAFSVN